MIFYWFVTFLMNVNKGGHLSEMYILIWYTYNEILPGVEYELETSDDNNSFNRNFFCSLEVSTVVY
jgi:hypothetical protein